MISSTAERAILLEDLDAYLKTILKFKLREFVHLNRCFSSIPSVDLKAYPLDVRNHRRLLNLEHHVPVAKRTSVCPNKKRIKARRRS
ncbi:MAG: hypothetical protein K8F91_05675, partial [Candidatus Obscuribacterales bacterium]|nr:hypothetical protein [Candidatus Obscuribacterales bacterium]